MKFVAKLAVVTAVGIVLLSAALYLHAWLVLANLGIPASMNRILRLVVNWYWLDLVFVAAGSVVVQVIISGVREIMRERKEHERRSIRNGE